jgi:E3 ubiquitin-protein ligase MARCH6
MSAGYLGLLLVVLLLRQIRSLYKLIRSQAPVRASEVLLLVSNFVNVVSCVVKVGFLLFLRVFLTPTLLGIFVLYTYNALAQYSGEEWTEFFCFNFIGGLILTWALGICNMLVVTLSVMQLREVLHPDILAKFIRPQEPQTELLSSLMHESGLMHVRRLFVSLLVYLTFMAVFLYLPALLVAEQVSTIPAHIWRMRTWYVLFCSLLVLPLFLSFVISLFLSVS